MSIAHLIPVELVDKITLTAYKMSPTPSAKIINDLVNNLIPSLHPPQSRIRFGNMTDEEFENYDWSEGDWGDFLYHYLHCGHQHDRVKHHPKLFKYVYFEDGNGYEVVDL